MPVTPDQKAARIKEDIRRVKSYDQWPWKVALPMKSQPWVSKEYGGGRFGVIYLSYPATVHATTTDGTMGPVLEKFESIEAMCNKWSVD